MTATAQPTATAARQTPLDEYFAFESQAEHRHEFIGEKIEAMAYTSPEHGQIASNLARLLGQCAREQGCTVFIGDRMLFVPGCNSVFYPDLMVVCGSHEYYQPTKNMKATLNPAVVVEILSDPTENLDKTTKTRCYKKIPSLRQIVLVSQRERHIRMLERDGDRWIDTEFYEENDLPKIGDCMVSLEEVYWNI